MYICKQRNTSIQIDPLRYLLLSLQADIRLAVHPAPVAHTAYDTRSHSAIGPYTFRIATQLPTPRRPHACTLRHGLDATSLRTCVRTSGTAGSAAPQASLLQQQHQQYRRSSQHSCKFLRPLPSACLSRAHRQCAAVGGPRNTPALRCSDRSEGEES